jgi:outer membrane protein assembly factor BamB
MGNRGGQEQVVAWDVKGSPRELWAATVGPVRYDGAGYPGPRSTPTFDEGKLYAIGLNGDLVCLNARDGKLVWRRDLVGELGGGLPNWGYSESPLVVGNWVLCTPGGARATVAALDKKTGATIWESPVGDRAAYSSIIAARLAGRDQFVQFTAQGVIGVAAADGKFLWRWDAPANGTANVTTPILVGDNRIFDASGYGAGGGVVEIKAAADEVKAEEVFFTRDMKNHHGGVILLDGYLYGSNDPGLLTCLDAKTGKVSWRDRSCGKGSLLYADGHFYVRSEEGLVSLVEATPEGFHLKGRFEQPDRSETPSWPHPVIADGRLFLCDQDRLLCYAVRSDEGS